MISLIVPIGIGGFIFFALWFWAILDCISTDSMLIRNLPKTTWIIVVIFVPTAGALAWLLVGRPEGAGLGVGGTYRPADYRTERWGKGPEDTREWHRRSEQIKPVASAIPAKTPEVPEADLSESPAVKERRLLEWEAELKKREAALGDDASASEGPDPESSD